MNKQLELVNMHYIVIHGSGTS